MTVAILDLPVHRWGVGNHRRVLAVHGVAANGLAWWRVGEGLAAHGFELWAPDLRGHGTAPSASSLLLDDFARDLRTLGDDWDVVIGHSLGGPIVCALLALGIRSQCVVLAEPVFEIPDGDFEEVTAGQMSECDPFATPEQFASANPRWHPLDAHIKAQAARCVSRWTVETAMRSNAPWHHRVLTAALTMPTVLLGADPSLGAFCPAALGEEIVSLLPSARFQVLPGAGHSIQRERPEAIVDAVLSVAAAPSSPSSSN